MARVLVPGVGAAPSAVDALQARGLWEPIRPWGAAGRPLLGVCRGAQLLLDGSDEGDAPGFGLVGGRCRAFPAPEAGGPRQVPHIGWNAVELTSAESFDAYFVHSYWPDAVPAAVAGRTSVEGFTFPSLLRAGAITGTQFHPEKSQRMGLTMLSSFARWAGVLPSLAQEPSG